jgi:protocatechuate 3,4-dioxygenase beta subunit
MAEHDHGLAQDMAVMRRRKVIGGLALLGAGAGAALWGRTAFGSEGEVTATGPDGMCIKATAETQGPFPADGSNDIGGTVSNVLAEAGVQRSDIRPSFGTMTAVADGIALTMKLQLVDVGGACAPLAGRAVYLWHCDASGKYSLYEATEANYLRGVGVTDAQGRVTFTTILPGCYPGRWPHVHFEVFKDIATATAGSAAGVVSQLAFPGEALAGLYAADARYAASVGNLAALSLATDNIFANNTAAQMTAQTLTLGGDTNGLLSAAIIGVAA